MNSKTNYLTGTCYNCMVSKNDLGYIEWGTAKCLYVSLKKTHCKAFIYLKGSTHFTKQCRYNGTQGDMVSTVSSLNNSSTSNKSNKERGKVQLKPNTERKRYKNRNNSNSFEVQGHDKLDLRIINLY